MGNHKLFEEIYYYITHMIMHLNKKKYEVIILILYYGTLI